MIKCLDRVLCLLQVLAAAHLALGLAGAEAPGDIIIGGMFAVHESVVKNVSDFYPQPDKCVSFNRLELVNVLAMINAIEKANRSPAMANTGLSLGYRIYDSCGDVSTALRATAELAQRGASPEGANSSSSSAATAPLQPVMAVVGSSFSEVTIAVAQQLTIHMIPQISYSSTAVILSDKSRFPAFMRTVPNDSYLAAAMVRLLRDNDWNWVGVLTTDGEYGRSALDSFMTRAFESGICVSFTERFPALLTSPAVTNVARQAAATVLGSPRVKVIVSFLSSTHMKCLLAELGRQAAAAGMRARATARVWVAGDSWSSSGSVVGRDVPLADVGHVVGFKFKQGNLASFRGYLNAVLSAGAAAANRVAFLQEFYAQLNAGGDAAPLGDGTHTQLVWSVEMAVNAIAEAIAALCGTRDCKLGGALRPWEVLRALRMQQFNLDGQPYRFDDHGDINQGYDVSLWRSEGGAVHVDDVVAEYHTVNNSLSLTDSSRRTQFLELRNTTSRCTDSCVPGQFKKTAEGQHTCCYECANCTENYYSNGTDMDQCLLCDPQREWSPGGSSHCTPKTLEFFSWDDGFAVVLLALAGAGLLLVLLLSCLFLRCRNTPVVRAAGGGLCQLILASLLGSFTSVILFVGHPSGPRCAARQVLFGLSFTLCVSCILVKSLKILLAFQFNPGIQQVLRRLYRPYAIIGCCMAVQVAICVCWLVLSGPVYTVATYPTTLLAQCQESSYVAFGAMLGYIAALALVCFLCAFKGRKLPHKYNDAKFITFGMLLYLISWTIFVPVYVTTAGRYVPAVEMVVILVSNYGVLSCHFLPKGYTILFRKEKNTTSAFKSNVYKYNLKSSASVSVSASVSASTSQENSLCQLGIVSALSPFRTGKEPTASLGSAKMDAHPRDMNKYTPLVRPPNHLRRSTSI